MTELNKLDKFDKILLAITVIFAVFVIVSSIANADECDVGMEVLGDCIAQYDSNESNKFVMYSLMLQDFNLTNCK